VGNAVEEKKQRADDEAVGEEEEGCGGCARLGLLILCDLCDQGYCLACANLTEQTVPPEHEPWFCHECDAEETEEAQRASRRRSGGARARPGGGARRARQAARQLGARYRMPRRGRRQMTLDGFVVDDGVEDDAEVQLPRELLSFESVCVPLGSFSCL
jgi:hypothetical protein